MNKFLEENKVTVTNPITEDFLQQQMVMWFNNKYCLGKNPNRYMIFAIPNGGKRNAREAKKLKNTGLLGGAADLEILGPDRFCCFVEVKLPSNNQQDNQKDFQNRVEKMGFKYYVVKSLEQFQELFCWLS